MLEADVDRGYARGQAGRGLGPKRVAFGLENRAAIERDADPAAAFRPQLVAAGGRDAQLANPVQRDPSAQRERREIAPGDFDAARPEASDEPDVVAHLCLETRWPAQAHHRRESDERRQQRHRDPPGPRARGGTRPAQERGRHRQAHERQGERQRAHVHGRLGRDRRPAQHGQNYETERDGERHAHEEGQQAQQARAF